MVDRNFYVRIFYVLYVALHLFAYEVLGLETKLAGKNYDQQWEQKISNSEKIYNLQTTYVYCSQK